MRMLIRRFATCRRIKTRLAHPPGTLPLFIVSVLLTFPGLIPTSSSMLGESWTKVVNLGRGTALGPLSFRPQDDNSGLLISESGQKLRGSLHLDGKGHVEGVSLHHCSLSTEDLKLIANIAGIKRLSLGNMDLLHLDTFPLASMGSLEYLTIADSSLTKKWSTFTSRLTRLKEIEDPQAAA